MTSYCLFWPQGARRLGVVKTLQVTAITITVSRRSVVALINHYDGMNSHFYLQVSKDIPGIAEHDEWPLYLRGPLGPLNFLLLPPAVILVLVVLCIP